MWVFLKNYWKQCCYQKWSTAASSSFSSVFIISNFTLYFHSCKYSLMKEKGVYILTGVIYITGSSSSMIILSKIYLDRIIQKSMTRFSFGYNSTFYLINHLMRFIEFSQRGYS